MHRLRRLPGSSPTVTTSLCIALAAAAASAPPAQNTPQALVVGHVHPVSGPPIENGVILIEDGEIRAVGPAGEVSIPDGAQVHRFPEGHAYPGLVDAVAPAYGDAAVVDATDTDAGTPVFGGLDATEHAGRALVGFGVTSIGVSNRGDGSWRGLGALVHPTRDGYQPVDAAHAEAAAVYLRAVGRPNAHPLDQVKALRALGAPFASLRDYREKLDKHEDALTEYREQFEKYLEYHRAKKGEGTDDEAGGEEKAEAAEQSGAPRGRRGGGRRAGRPRGERPTPPADSEEKPTSTESKPADPAPADGEGEATEKPATEGKGDKDGAEEAPKRPDYPKPPAPDPAKDALLQVADGELALHVEAHTRVEIETAIWLKRAHSLPRMVLEGGREAAAHAAELATAGVPVIATCLLQAPAEPGAPDPRAVPAALAEAGVEVAIASGSARTARHLTMLAAIAAGHGLDPDAAVRAITLTPAEILGIGQRVGSLEVGKRADVLVTSAPLLHSDARVLAVLAAGAMQETNG